MPRKYQEAWKTLIDQHVHVGCLRPSNSAHASPAFLVPKTDPNMLPQWVNDYRVLNSNMVLDAFLLPWVDDILADCAQGMVWSMLDITNSFFQTLMKLEDIWKTAVMTLFRLYKWIVMLMGLWNSPPIREWHGFLKPMWVQVRVEIFLPTSFKTSLVNTHGVTGKTRHGYGYR